MKIAFPIVSLCLIGAAAMAYEEPDYEVLIEADEYEIRRYESYIVAETDVTGDFKSAGNEAFRILAGYIFGGNQSAEKMEMTAPVESREAGGVKMAMTVPVTSTNAGTTTGTDATDGGIGQRYTYGFVMERAYTLETLPVPDDPRVRIREVEPRVMAVRRYSGRWTESNYDSNEDALLEALEQDGARVAGEPLLARYNGPFTPWFLRRNEVMVEIVWPADGAQQTRRQEHDTRGRDRGPAAQKTLRANRGSRGLEYAW